MKKLMLVVLGLILSVMSFGRDIKIGVIAPLSGPLALYGQTTVNGYELAVKEINAKGGINGMNLVLIKEDNKGDSAESVAAIKKLITVNKVDVILGGVTSGNTIAIAPIAQEYKLPMLTPTATNVKVTTFGDYISRTCFIDPFQGEVMANFASDNLKAKKAIIIKNAADDYSEGLAVEFEKTFKANGGKIVDVINYVTGDIDFSSQLTKIKNMNTDVIFLPGYYNEVALVVKQARDLGIDATFLGGDGWDNSKLFEIGGTSVNGSYVLTHFSKESEDTQVQDFINNYFNEFFEDPSPLSALGYDAAYIMAEAIKKAGSLDREKIKNAINSTKNYKGVTGVISLDKNRNAKKSAFVLKAENGAFIYETTVDPK
ncbi:MAG: branched-chain amino acid transport system substrate-binding protein [Fusobacteriaceae bacterium]|jgi:branched-chain amino acid transport system substrate-binding protein|nr:Branched-chain amino acid transporteramino acid-binding protein [Fusobacteriales bacterium]MDN5303569.1 branched-chain amino acid transport system substrate-binding protein [Fusobacteriaceae bacterium]